MSLLERIFDTYDTSTERINLESLIDEPMFSLNTMLKIQRMKVRDPNFCAQSEAKNILAPFTGKQPTNNGTRDAYVSFQMIMNAILVTLPMKGKIRT